MISFDSFNLEDCEKGSFCFRSEGEEIDLNF